MSSTVAEPLPRRTLGRTGIAVSALGAGCWPLGGPDENLGMPMGWAEIDDGTAVAALERAFERGVTLFDTADVYGHGRSERRLGRLVAQVPRDQLVLTSKVGYFAGTAAHGYDPGHMRRQLEQSLQNLGTDVLDVYFLHHPDFGPEDCYLDGAVAAMRDFQAEGLVRAIGMRGPHRFAVDRLTTGPHLRGDKIARFRALFDVVNPDVLAVRDNLLTPGGRSEGIFALADAHGCGVLVNKALSQGLLTGTYRPGRERVFGAGDHRSRKRWFGPAAGAVMAAGIDELGALVGGETTDLIRIALWSCLSRSPHAVVLVGFTSVQQAEMDFGCLREPPDPATIEAARKIMSRVQATLDAGGEVFADELTDTKGAR
ncbi:aldo/keto reductase [Actinoplanes sp. NBRC 103695]|uniref:aldo/keto reductase n=1 Tax=Actinoplanes sp. NBRC 103695 TaxID=3032202 RepID=UPI0024A22FE6|nr:aldo/keto reductase [Actinoplanes sp. NBRC 103695]GLY99797.1 oxidoreductase [Actinoplanes sp. NBRC 103695]